MNNNNGSKNNSKENNNYREIFIDYFSEFILWLVMIIGHVYILLSHGHMQ